MPIWLTEPLSTLLLGASRSLILAGKQAISIILHAYGINNNENG